MWGTEVPRYGVVRSPSRPSSSPMRPAPMVRGWKRRPTAAHTWLLVIRLAMPALSNSMRTPAGSAASWFTVVCRRNVTPCASIRLRRMRATSGSTPGRISAPRASTVTREPRSV